MTLGAHKSISLYLDQGSGKSTLSAFISYGPELKNGDKRVESLPTAIYRFVESPSSLAVMYGGWWTILRESTCIDIIRTSGTSSGFEDPEGACPREVEVGSGPRSGQSWYYRRGSRSKRCREDDSGRVEECSLRGYRKGERERTTGGGERERERETRKQERT